MPANHKQTEQAKMRRLKVYVYLQAHGAAPARAIVAKLQMPHNTVARCLRDLKAAGRVTAQRLATRHGYIVFYRAAP